MKKAITHGLALTLLSLIISGESQARGRKNFEVGVFGGYINSIKAGITQTDFFEGYSFGGVFALPRNSSRLFLRYRYGFQQSNYLGLEDEEFTEHHFSLGWRPYLGGRSKSKVRAFLHGSLDYMFLQGVGAGGVGASAGGGIRFQVSPSFYFDIEVVYSYLSFSYRSMKRRLFETQAEVGFAF